jgi:protoporphyrinogen oxidase
MVPRKLRQHFTPCIRKIFLDDLNDTSITSQTQAIEALEAELRAERQKNAELEQEKEALSNERDSLYRLINVYKTREKELESKDRRQKFQVANQVDELMHDNQRLQARLEEAQSLLT